MRFMSHCQARLTGSNASSPSSASVVRNWIAKNGLPPVFSCTSCARGRTEDPPEHQLEAVLRLSRRQFWNGRLFSDEDLDLRDEVDDQLPIRTQSLLKRVPPRFHLRFALDEDLTDQTLEGLCQGRVGNLALVLGELRRPERAPR